MKGIGRTECMMAKVSSFTKVKAPYGILMERDMREIG